MKRQRSITLAGWLWIVIGALLILWCGVAFLHDLRMLKKIIVELLSREHPLGSGDAPIAISIIFGFPIVFLFTLYFLRAPMGAFFIISGLHLLRLHSWARKGLLITSWVGLIILLVGLMNPLMWFFMSVAIYPESDFDSQMASDPGPVSIPGLVLCAGLVLVPMALYVLTMILLHKKTVRRAFLAVALDNWKDGRTDLPENEVN